MCSAAGSSRSGKRKNRPTVTDDDDVESPKRARDAYYFFVQAQAGSSDSTVYTSPRRRINFIASFTHLPSLTCFTNYYVLMGSSQEGALTVIPHPCVDVPSIFSKSESYRNFN